MEGAQFLLEAVLVLLLAATLFHALRLERALGVLKRDRAVLEDLVAGFNESTRAAEAGIDRLRASTDGAGRQIARQIELAQRLRDDLGFLTERGDKLAERLETGVRSARMYADQAGFSGGAGMHGSAMNGPGVNGVGLSGVGLNGAGSNGAGSNSFGMNGSGMMHAVPRQVAHQVAAAGAVMSPVSVPMGGPTVNPAGAVSRHEDDMVPAYEPPAYAPPANAGQTHARPSQAGSALTGPDHAAAEPAAGPRLRSEAERDLLRALRAAR